MILGFGTRAEYIQILHKRTHKSQTSTRTSKPFKHTSNKHITEHTYTQHHQHQKQRNTRQEKHAHTYTYTRRRGTQNQSTVSTHQLAVDPRKKRTVHPSEMQQHPSRCTVPPPTPRDTDTMIGSPGVRHGEDAAVAPRGIDGGYMRRLNRKRVLEVGVDWHVVALHQERDSGGATRDGAKGW